MIAAILNQALVAMTVQSAYEILISYRTDGWEDTQNLFGQQLKITFDRIRLFDNFVLNSQIHNAEFNLNYIFSGSLPSSPQQVSD